jgi:uncharacterized LabA/DUF88 family protein
VEQRQEQARLAVLIDVDNAQPTVVQTLLAEVANYGIATVKRAYGDWTTSRLNGWKAALNEYAIQPVQQFGYTSGKNATDSALIIDAMDLLYSGRLQGFCIVSSDSDFTRLATRLRESGMTVYGFGEQKTPRAFVSDCDKFIYTEILVNEDEHNGSQSARASTKKTAKELRADTKLVNLLRTAAKSSADEEGWSQLGTMGLHIANHAPDFDPRNYGYAKLGQLVLATELFEIQERTSKSGHAQKYIRDSRTKKASA